MVTEARLDRALHAFVRTTSYTLGVTGVGVASKGSEHRRMIYFTVVTGFFWLRREKPGEGALNTTYRGLHELSPWLLGQSLV